MKRTILDVVQSTTLMWQNLCGQGITKWRRRKLHSTKKLKSQEPRVFLPGEGFKSHILFIQLSSASNWGSKRNIRWGGAISFQGGVRICYLSCWKLCMGGGWVQAPWCAGCLPLTFCLKWAGCSGAGRCAREKQGTPWHHCLTSQLLWVVWNQDCSSNLGC